METHTQNKMYSSRFSQVLCRVRVLLIVGGTLPGCLTTLHLECGRLATTHPGAPRAQRQSRYDLLSSRHGAFVRVAFEDGTWRYVTNSGAIGSASGICCGSIY